MSKYMKRRTWTDRVKAVKGIRGAVKWVSGALDRLTAADKESGEKENVLLQSYFTSLLSLVLCVGMFLGTSYAWFTSEVTNTSNEIYIGILKVDLEKQDKQNAEQWLSLSETNAEVSTNQLFDSGISWTPGHIAMETIRISQQGDLAFNYVLNFTDGKISAENLAPEMHQSLADVAKHFDVWVYDNAQTEGKANPTTYAEITAQNSGWEKAGTLDQILGGKTVLSGSMDAKPVAAQQTEPQPQTRTYTIALHMDDAADAAVMGHKIGLNIKLIAYQASGENEGFGDGTGAGITAVTELEDLKNKLAGGNANILLAGDMAIDDAENRLIMNGGVLDGYGKTVSYTVEKAAEDPSLGVVTVSGGTVRNLTIHGGRAGRALYSEKLTSDLLVSNCVLDGVYAFNLSGTEATAYTMRFVDTTFASWTSYANVMKTAEFVNCTFGNVLRPYGETVLTGCTFDDQTLDVSELEEGECIELVDCTYDGITGVNATVRAENDKLTVECEGVTAEISNGILVIRSND